MTAEVTLRDLPPATRGHDAGPFTPDCRRAESDAFALRAGLRACVLDAVAADCPGGLAETLPATGAGAGAAGGVRLDRRVVATVADGVVTDDPQGVLIG